MTELIPVKQKEDGTVATSGRDLHSFLEIATKYEDWFPRMTEYGFREEDDYHALKIENMVNGRVYFKTDHALTISMAKEISMIQRNEKGKQARRYFIKVEEAWNSPEMVMKRALEYADKQILSLQEQITLDRPKTLFAEAVETSKSSILIGELAKVLRQNGVEIGQQRLFKWLRANGYLIKRGAEYNNPTQYSIERGWFEIKKRTGVNPDGSTWASSTTKVTGKGQIYFVNKFLAEKKDIA